MWDAWCCLAASEVRDPGHWGLVATPVVSPRAAASALHQLWPESACRLHRVRVGTWVGVFVGDRAPPCPVLCGHIQVSSGHPFTGVSGILSYLNFTLSPIEVFLAFLLDSFSKQIFRFPLGGSEGLTLCPFP